MAFLPGAVEGYKFLFMPEWSDLLKVDTWVMAMGQAFFSLSITGSGMIVYGTDPNKSEDIPKASMRTAMFDTLAAMLAALAIMPAVFAFGIEPNAGPPLIFITLPNIFKQMPFGQLFAAVFFLSVAFAGITSLINMFEAVSESLQTRFKLPRKAAVALCAGVALLVGIFLEAEPNVGSWHGFHHHHCRAFRRSAGRGVHLLYPGYKDIQKELGAGERKAPGRHFGPLAKYVYVPLAVVVFILGLVYGGIG